jgi:hypothetical protein
MPSAPVGPVAWVCLLLGVFLCFPPLNRCLIRALFDAPTRSYLIGIGTLSFALSLLYVHTYLGGAPRIIDATAYLLQAKVLATGSYTFEPPGALHSFAGRFLVETPDGNLSVLFPPGFAAVLALGVTLGVPLLVNPAIGALIAVLTYQLGAAWFSERDARIAGVLSVLCACLRYHSADTMSHAWAAALTLGLLVLATSEHNQRHLLSFGAGVCAGWLFATRPVTGVVLGSAGLAFVYMRANASSPWKNLLQYAFGATPGIMLWWSYQFFTTGSAWTTTQSQYYLQSDWPEGCFRLGFASSIGCRFEHGDFLDRYQPNGFGLLEALRVTGRRLGQHQRDVTNFPFLALCALGLTVRRSAAQRRALMLTGIVAAHMAAYALFYFDGNYPGGGARLFVDILPLEHVLLGVAFARLRIERWVTSICLIGFALWSVSEHEALAAREGGRPMYQEEVLRRHGVRNGLVFVSTDHGFNLGFEPNVTPNDRVLVARQRNDGFDFATWASLGRPPAFVYHLEAEPPSPARVTVTPYQPPNSLRFEGRGLWPIRVTAGSAVPMHNPDGLRLMPATRAPFTAELEVPISHDDYYELRLELRAPSPSTLVVSGWVPVIDEGRDGTRDRCFGPRFLRTGSARIELRSENEVGLLSVTLIPAANTGTAPPQPP